MTYTLIDSEVLASAAASVTFSSIPADYRDLVLVVSGKSSSGTIPAQIRLNGSSVGYNYVGMSGNGSSPASFSGSSMDFGNLSDFASMTASNDVVWIFQFMDYSQTNKHKTVLSRANAANSGTDAIAMRWANTAAITSITLQVYLGAGGNFAAGNTFYLYGIEA
jgi:hypothetical protein